MELDRLLEELEQKGLANDAHQTTREQKYLNITRDTGEFLRVLVRATGARRILEVGTSNGYSTLWLAASLVGEGRVTTIEHDPHKAQEAAANFVHAGLTEQIELLQGDAAPLLREIERPFDLIFLDADRTTYVELFAELERLLKDGGLLVCDNAISHATELAPFMHLLRQHRDFTTALVPVGKGEFLAHKLRVADV